MTTARPLSSSRGRRSLRRRAAATTRYLAQPGPGLAGTWVVVLITTAVIGGPDVATWVFLVTCCAAWAAVLLVAAVTPPAPPLSASSALLARVLTLSRTIWGAFVFAVGALYGAVVGLSFSAQPDVEGGPLGAQALAAVVLPVVQVVAGLAGWYALMACAWDLWRAGPEARLQAAQRLRDRLRAWHPEWPHEHPAAYWGQSFVLWMSSGPRPALFCYLSPLALYEVWRRLEPLLTA